MISLYSNWWIKPGKEKKAIPLLRKLARNIKKNEPGTLRYEVHFAIQESPKKYDFKSIPPSSAGAVTFVETYRSWKAFNDHFNGKAFTEFVAAHGDLFQQTHKDKDGKSGPIVEVTFLDKVAGFIRK